MRKKLTTQEIDEIHCHSPSNREMAIDYHINGNEYAVYDYWIKAQGEANKEFLVSLCKEYGEPYRP